MFDLEHQANTRKKDHVLSDLGLSDDCSWRILFHRSCFGRPIYLPIEQTHRTSLPRLRFPTCIARSITRGNNCGNEPQPTNVHWVTCTWAPIDLK